MRRSFYFLPIAIVTGSFTYFLVERIISPYNESGNIDGGNVALVLFFFSITIFSLLSFIFSVIDKLFFKKFYQPPNYAKVIKYSGLISLLLFVNLFTKILGYLDIYIVSASILIMIIIPLIDIINRKNNNLRDQKD